ncbi:MAG: flagellar protein FlaG [Lachnospiraceae bacterium]|nr:flagellar protein FlaG [Lachnospiraceae bacterium]
MAGIEPISSAMTYQVQSAPRTVTSTDADTESRKASDNAAEELQAQAPDKTTLTVQEAGESSMKGGENGEDEASSQSSNESLKKAVEEYNKSLSSNTEAIFGIHEGTNRVTIKILDKDTKEVVKELPPEKTLDMLQRIWEMAGILVDEKR